MMVHHRFGFMVCHGFWVMILLGLMMRLWVMIFLGLIP